MAALDDPAQLAAPVARTDELAEIEGELERARTRVAASMRTLGEEVTRRGDWRAWVRARPELVLAGALVLGFIWGRGRAAPRSS
jgi:hypothetical protein